MRLLLLISAFLLSQEAALSGQSAFETTLLQTEQKRFTAMVQRDIPVLESMLDESLVYIHSNALAETKQLHLQAIRTGTLVYQSMEREQGTRVRRFGKVALTNGIVRVNGILNGNAFSARLRYTAAYRKQKNHWLLINWQSTRIPNE